jgi:hypothetical protein
MWKRRFQTNWYLIIQIAWGVDNNKKVHIMLISYQTSHTIPKAKPNVIKARAQGCLWYQSSLADAAVTIQVYWGQPERLEETSRVPWVINKSMDQRLNVGRYWLAEDHDKTI